MMSPRAMPQPQPSPSVNVCASRRPLLLGPAAMVALEKLRGQYLTAGATPIHFDCDFPTTRGAPSTALSARYCAAKIALAVMTGLCDVRPLTNFSHVVTLSLGSPFRLHRPGGRDEDSATDPSGGWTDGHGVDSNAGPSGCVQYSHKVCLPCLQHLGQPARLA